MNVDHLFKDDEKRNNLAKKNLDNFFYSSYRSSPKVINKNTGQFWDRKIKRESSKIDCMAEDRINKAINLMSVKSKVILDIGVGSGTLIKEISKTHPKINIFGIDITKRTLNDLKKNTKLNIRQGSILKIPLKEKFDTIFALEVLEHLHPKDTFKAYNEIKRVLKQGGQVIISVPVNEKYSSHNNPNEHMRRYYPIIIYKELDIAGFKVYKKIQLYAFSSFYKVKVFIAKYLLRNRWKPNVVLLAARKK